MFTDEAKKVLSVLSPSQVELVKDYANKWERLFGYESNSIDVSYYSSCFYFSHKKTKERKEVLVGIDEDNFPIYEEVAEFDDAWVSIPR